ncbi:MAG: bifunctional riboflavin kinase/FAD synthetase [Rhodospirillaceae bacterium]|nr:bifunctional riboflavin kinase/FAD synthetase [Rhodospirillaceae bacterium]
MRIVRHWQSTPADARGAVVAVGNFDGVHLGHRAVIDEGRRIARSLGAPLAVLTFEPHPRQVLAAPKEPFRLTPLRIKARHLAALGVDVLFVARFDRAFAAREPASFVADVVAAGIGARHVVVGHDFAFGRGRAGTVALLTEVGGTLGVGVTSIEAAGTGTTIHSASRARRLLSDGDVAALPEVLGRYWEIDGHVVAGDRRGRTIGFPTANLRCAGILHPARGVYALWAQPAGDARWYPAVANLGRRPTFDKTEDLLEVHIFDYAADLYGRRLRAAFADRVRPERRFDGIDALKAQIADDCDAARAILARSPAPDTEESAALPRRQASS